MAASENLLKQAVSLRKQLGNNPSTSMIFQEPPKRRVINERKSVKISKPNVQKSFKIEDTESGNENKQGNEQRWFDPNKSFPTFDARTSHVTDDQYDSMFYHGKGETPPNDVHHVSGEELAIKYSQAAANRVPTQVNKEPQQGFVPQAAIPQKPQEAVSAQTPIVDVYEHSQTNEEDFLPLDELPSRGVFYKTPMLAQPLRLIDMLMVENMDNDNKMNTITEILGRRTRCDGGALQILTGDEIYTLQYLRASTFPKDPYTWTKFTCEHCGTIVDDTGYKIDFTNMRFTTNVDPTELFGLYREYGYYPIEKIGGVNAVEVYVRRRFHDYLYKEQIDEWKRIGFTPTKPYLALLNMALVVDIPGCNTMQSKIDFLGNLTKDDAARFLSELSKCSFRTKTMVAHTCPNCGGVTVTPFPFRYSTFISSIQVSKSEKT
jgi:predicted RNA-binding Zn-ribbon protein involved in translation (DUF1610 family)